MYESPAYTTLTRHIEHWRTVQRYVDLARTFRSMAYGANLILTSEPGLYDSALGSHSVTLKDSLRTDALKFLADRCEEIAAKIGDTELPKIDIREACKT